MNTIMMVTHPGIGTSLREAALRTLNKLPCEVIAIDCPQDANTQDITEKALELLRAKSATLGLIIFTDILGATPHNTAQMIFEKAQQKAHIISGINLPMLLRTLNYIDLPLEDVCKKAVKGGSNGICDCRDQQEGLSL